MLRVTDCISNIFKISLLATNPDEGISLVLVDFLVDEVHDLGEVLQYIQNVLIMFLSSLSDSFLLTLVLIFADLGASPGGVFGDKGRIALLVFMGSHMINNRAAIIEVVLIN